MRDEGFAHRIRDLKKNFTVSLGFDKIPYNETLIQRQRFQQIGNIRRVQLLKLLLQFGKITAGRLAFKRQVVTLNQFFDQPLLA